jgi:NADH-quinone oxidoreductase subunit L
MEATIGNDSNTSQDIRNMGNLRAYMPITFWTYIAGYLALAGFPLLSGFWSKDEILAHAFDDGHIFVWIVLTLASFLTAFYMTRQVLVVFFGQFRGHSPRRATHPSEPAAVEHAHGHDEHAGEHEHGGHDPHESPWTMWLPLVILALFAVLGGFVNLPIPGMHFLAEFFGQEAGTLNPLVMGFAIVVALAGIGLGWALYSRAYRTADEPDPLERLMPRVFGALNQRLYFDEIYASTFGRLSYGLALAWSWLDRHVLDAFVNGTGVFTLLWGRINFILDDLILNDGVDALSDGTNAAGDGARQIETGKIQDYVSLIFLGVVVLGVIYLYGFRK